MNRRNFIKNAAGLFIAAPMVVKASSIMTVKPVAIETPRFVLGYSGADDRWMAISFVERYQIHQEYRNRRLIEYSDKKIKELLS